MARSVEEELQSVVDAEVSNSVNYVPINHVELQYVLYFHRLDQVELRLRKES